MAGKKKAKVKADDIESICRTERCHGRSVMVELKPWRKEGEGESDSDSAQGLGLIITAERNLPKGQRTLALMRQTVKPQDDANPCSSRWLEVVVKQASVDFLRPQDGDLAKKASEIEWQVVGQYEACGGDYTGYYDS